MDSVILSHLPLWPALFCFSALSAFLLFIASFSRKSQPESLLPQLTKIKPIEEPDCYPPVEPLPNFEWTNVEPVKIRPFKPKYNLTMSTSFLSVKVQEIEVLLRQLLIFGYQAFKKLQSVS